MRILRDECLLRQLARELVGHDVCTITQEGWSGIKNGELLRLAAQEYEVFITIDQLLATERQIPLSLAVITLKASTNRIESLRPIVPAILQAISTAKPGEGLQVSA